MSGLLRKAPFKTQLMPPRLAESVDISAGTHSESLVIDKNITLRGVSSATTIIQPAEAEQRVIMVTSGHNLRLENLTITGGSLPSSAGGGVYLENGGLELVSCVVSNNAASYGGGIFQRGTSSSLIATDSQILGNAATFHGGGMYVEGNATLTNTTLSGNTARCTWRRSTCGSR